MEKKPIWENIKDYVTEKKLSQKQIAENMNITEPRLSLMLNGKRKITVDDYLSICKAIAVPPTKFLNN
ncbi:MAG: helix-turn-helix transcriptional regulator [Oscillospiraceae bacterium]|nr:helix-turn-helix transcriptional regulator [Oscillospiraceae bacterium]